MCSHYQAIKERERFLRLFGVYPPDPDGKFDMWPGYTGGMVVILPPAAQDVWLDAPAHQSMELLQPYPADRLVAST